MSKSAAESPTTDAAVIDTNDQSGAADKSSVADDVTSKENGSAPSNGGGEALSSDQIEANSPRSADANDAATANSPNTQQDEPGDGAESTAASTALTADNDNDNNNDNESSQDAKSATNTDTANHHTSNNNNNNNNHYSEEDQCEDEEYEDAESTGPDEEAGAGKFRSFAKKRTLPASLNGNSGGGGGGGGSSGSSGKRPRRQSTEDKPAASVVKPGSDKFCWRCHRICRLGDASGVLYCAACPRVFHQRCSPPGGVSPAVVASTVDESSTTSSAISSIVCPDCAQALALETALASRPDAEERLVNLADALVLLCESISALPKSMPFREPVSTDVAPDYADFVCHPTDLASLKAKAVQREFSSVEAFLSESKWLLHNCIVYNGSQAPISVVAKQLMQAIKREAACIEQCATCYLYGDRKFASLCPTAHPLVWARLRNWPQWPGKVVGRRPDGSLEIVFFGTHDRAVLPSTCVTFHSAESGAKGQIAGGSGGDQLDLALKELATHIKNLQGRYGDALQLPAPDTPYSESLAEKLFGSLRPKCSSSSAASSGPGLSNKRPRRSSKASVGGLDSQPARPSSRGSSSLSCQSPAVEAKSAKSPAAASANSAAAAAQTNESAVSNSTADVSTGAKTVTAGEEKSLLSKDRKTTALSVATTSAQNNTASGSSSAATTASAAATDHWLEQMRVMAVRSFTQALEQSLAQLTCSNPASLPSLPVTMPTDVSIETANSSKAPQQPQQPPPVSIATKPDEEIATLKQKLLILSRQNAADRAKLVFRHQLQVHEMEHNHRLAMCEQRAAFDIEKQKVLSDAVHSMEAELKRKIEETKKKQWCAFCRKEAFFYCCWNTSYCDTTCQQKHWPQHMATCTQARAAVVPPVAAVTPSSLSAAAAVAAAAAAAAASSSASSLPSGGGGGSGGSSSSNAYRQLIGR